MTAVGPSLHVGPVPWRGWFVFGRKRRLRARRQARAIARLDRLEARVAPAVYDVPGGMSLSAAIAAADANGDAQNTIDVAPGTYAVVGQRIQAASTKSLAIAGQGPGVTLRSDGKSNRVLEIDANVLLEDLTITKGYARDGGLVGGPAALGGGVLIDGGDVTLSDVTVLRNTAQGGSGIVGPGGRGTPGGDGERGGIYLAGGNLVLIHSDVLYDQALGGNGGPGGSHSSAMPGVAGVGGAGGYAAGGPSMWPGGASRSRIPRSRAARSSSVPAGRAGAPMGVASTWPAGR
jgi:hypothetical protein